MATLSGNFEVNATLAAGVADTVTLNSNMSKYISVKNRSASGAIRFTTDGSTPTATQANDCHIVDPGERVVAYSGPGKDTVKVICATANDYEVKGVRDGY